MRVLLMVQYLFHGLQSHLLAILPCTALSDPLSSTILCSSPNQILLSEAIMDQRLWPTFVISYDTGLVIWLAVHHIGYVEFIIFC